MALVLRRKNGQTVEVTHKSGDAFTLRVTGLSGEGQGRVELVLDDDARNFRFERPERAAKLRVHQGEFVPPSAHAVVGEHVSIRSPEPAA